MHNEIMARRQLKTSCSLYEALAAQRVQERGYRQIEVSAASPLPTYWAPQQDILLDGKIWYWGIVGMGDSHLIQGLKIHCKIHI